MPDSSFEILAEIQSVSRDFMADRCAPSTLRAALGDVESLSGALWPAAAELGWAQIAAPEDVGGLGLGLRGALRVAEEVGYAVAPVPFCSSAVLATSALCVEDASDAIRRRASALLDDGAIGAVALTGPEGRTATALIDMRATRVGTGWLLEGRTGPSFDLPLANMIVVAARHDDDVLLFVVDTGAAGVSVEALHTIDVTRSLGVLECREVVVSDDDLLSANRSQHLRDRLLAVGALMLSADSVGAARRALDVSTEYSMEREQFGRKIGSFQAVKHRLADMYTQVRSASALVEGAGGEMDASPESVGRLCRSASCYGREMATRVAAAAVQVHGGIGVTWEHDCHLFLKRVKLNELMYGDPSTQREALATILASGSN